MRYGQRVISDYFGYGVVLAMTLRICNRPMAVNFDSGKVVGFYLDGNFSYNFFDRMKGVREICPRTVPYWPYQKKYVKRYRKHIKSILDKNGKIDWVHKQDKELSRSRVT